MHQRVYEQVSDAFASGVVLPGQRIVIRELARALGTSMMPIREALHRLEAENAVVATTGRNLSVPIMTAADYEELCLIRTMIEGLAAEEAAKNMTPEELDAVARAATLMEEASDAQDLEGAMRYNRQFHFAVYRAARRPLLFKIIESLWLRAGPQLAYLFRHDIHKETSVRSTLHPHRYALAAFRARDSKAAGLAIAYDISRAARIIIDHLSEIDRAKATNGSPSEDAARRDKGDLSRAPE
jgi:DNA-binding GntR family transcriptional regulator